MARHYGLISFFLVAVEVGTLLYLSLPFEVCLQRCLFERLACILTGCHRCVFCLRGDGPLSRVTYRRVCAFLSPYSGTAVISSCRGRVGLVLGGITWVSPALTAAFYLVFFPHQKVLKYYSSVTQLTHLNLQCSSFWWIHRAVQPSPQFWNISLPPTETLYPVGSRRCI